MDQKAVRLDKYLCDAGAGSRSEVKNHIKKGKVLVDGSIEKKPERKVIPGTTKIEMDGKPVEPLPEFEYFLLYKPSGCVTATQDQHDKTVMDYLSSDRKDLFPVGRLDKDTEGLLLITNDGPLAHRLLSPAKHVSKTYYALVSGRVLEEDIEKVREGLDIGDDKKTLPGKLEILKALEDQSEILLTITEGRFHQVKRMMESLGKPVTYLKRVRMGPLTLDPSMQSGQCRRLTQAEVNSLKK